MLLSNSLFFRDRDEVWHQMYLLQGSNISMQEDYPREIEQRRARLYLILKHAKFKRHKDK